MGLICTSSEMLFVALFTFLLSFSGNNAKNSGSSETLSELVNQNDYMTTSQEVSREYSPETFSRLLLLLESMNASMTQLNQRLQIVETQTSNLTMELEGIKNWININSTETQADNVDRPDDLWILTMVTHAKSRLYSGENYKGKFEDYSSDTAPFKGGCYNLERLGGKIKSVDTYSKCVRLFSGSSCEGWSVAIYPGSGPAGNLLSSKLETVNSVGPCLPEEFQNASFKDTGKQMIVKNSSDFENFIPDEVEFYSLDCLHDSRTSLDSGISLDAYKLGPQNRVEFLQAMIYPKHLHIPQPNFDMENTDFFKSLDRHTGDVVGYGIPLALGGPANQTFNVFPQSSSGYEEWNRTNTGVTRYLERGRGYVEVALTFLYSGNLTSRPHAFYYWIQFGGDRNEVSYGRVRN
ncbi:unnamed protein product [Allacma fusca]|uniref:Uncharacterized protein n=1 Tax=Allacma fusca TaxID=39272 RepID=A0A8J2JR69_9HEXA|nr:unnamed protein product [Allacma fusca]